MAATTVVCPHCEKPFEIQVAAVTRSRICPHCGQTLLLQVTEKSGPMKRRALLMGPTATDKLAMAAEGPQALAGDPFDRMRADPALQSTLRKFYIGVGVVIGLIIVAVVFHLIEANRPQVIAAPPVRVAPKEEPQQVQHVQPAFAPISMEERLEKLREQHSGKRDVEMKAPADEPPPAPELSNATVRDEGRP